MVDEAIFLRYMGFSKNVMDSPFEICMIKGLVRFLVTHGKKSGVFSKGLVARSLLPMDSLSFSLLVGSCPHCSRGIEMWQSPGEVFLGQCKNVVEIFNRFETMGRKPLPGPMI